VNTPDTIRLWLATKLPNGAADSLWFKDIHTSHTPSRDGRDRVELWEETDDRATLMCWVKERYWDHTGRCNIELWDIVVNPTDVTLAQMMHRSGAISWTSTSETLDGLLLAGGWAEWGTP
jgi:hypothetical protein